MTLTEKQRSVLEMLRQMFAEEGKPVSPTWLGMKLGFDYNSASARTSPVLKRLVELGLAERTDQGLYVPKKGVVKSC